MTFRGQPEGTGFACGVCQTASEQHLWALVEGTAYCDACESVHKEWVCPNCGAQQSMTIHDFKWEDRY